MNVFAERYFYISPDEAARRVFGDAAAVFFARDGMIAASRAPASVLRPAARYPTALRREGSLPSPTECFSAGRTASPIVLPRRGSRATSFCTALSGSSVFRLRYFPLRGKDRSVLPLSRRRLSRYRRLRSVRCRSQMPCRAIRYTSVLPTLRSRQRALRVRGYRSACRSDVRYRYSALTAELLKR